MEGLYVPRIWDWCSILRSQTDADASRAANMCHMEGTLAAGGELVCTFTGEYASEDQVIHLELPATHELLVIALEHLKVLCILDSCLPSLLVDEVDIITPELVLCGFVICLDTGGGGGDGDFWGGGRPQPLAPRRKVSPLWPDWVMSSCLITHTEAHQFTWHYAFSSSHRCVS
jgi:hypothetical protein